MKKLSFVLIICLMFLCLTACGGKVDPSDPNQGIWKATTGEMLGISMSVEEFFEKGFTIELQEKGKCVLNVDGKKANGSWTLNNGAFTIKGGGMDCEGRLENGALTLENVLDMGLNLVFEKEGGYSGSASAILGDAGYYVIDSIVQEGETYDLELLKEMGIKYYVRLNEDGSAEISTDSLIKGTWTPGKLQYKEDGEDVVSKYTLDKDLLTIALGDADIMLVFKRSGDTSAIVPGQVSTDSSDIFSWWEGDWYGYIYLPTADGVWESLEDGVWDCFGTIECDASGVGTFYLWDDGGELANVELQITEFGVSSAGVAMSESGTFNKAEIRHAEWIIDPGTNTQSYEHLIIIDGTFEDPRDSEDGGFMYEIWLRPWGMLWDDAVKEDQPPGYDDWYLRRYTSPMPTMSEFMSGEDQPNADNGGNGTSSNASGPLVGTWFSEGDGAGGTVNKDYVYEFNADGTGVYTIFGDARPFTYKVDGNTVQLVLYPGTSDETTDDFEFELDGDTLKIITWISTRVYIRQ